MSEQTGDAVGKTQVNPARREFFLAVLAIAAAFTAHLASSFLYQFLSELDAAPSRVRQTLLSGGWVLLWSGAFYGAMVLLYRSSANPLPSRLDPSARSSAQRRVRSLWWAAGVGAMALYGVAASLHASLTGHHVSTLWLGVYVLVLIVCVGWMWNRRDQIMIVHTAVAGEIADWQRRSHLVLALSTAKPRPPIEWSSPANLRADLDTLATAKRRKENPIEYWPWEPALRAVHAHRATGPQRQQVILLGSRESVVQATEFSKCVKGYGLDVDVRAWVNRNGTMELVDPLVSELVPDNGIRFNDLNDISGAFMDLLRKLEEMGVPHNEIVIDFTGGQKPVSFVAAAVTLRNRVLAQYVDTVTDKVLVYDIIPNTEARGL